jgi:stage II sporulation protein D
MTPSARRRLGVRAAFTAGLLALAPARPRAADEFSGADKLRALYSAEFRFTDDGLPVVPVAIAQGAAEVSISVEGGGGLRLLPEGDGGPEVVADDAWRVRAERTRPAKLRHWAIVWRGRAQQGGEAAAQARAWKARGPEAKVFEQGTLFAVAGEVLDRRELLVGVEPAASWEAAEKTLERLKASDKLASPGIFTELLDRPHGELEAVGARTGARVRNEGVLWFAASGGRPLQVEWRRAGAEGAGRGGAGPGKEAGGRGSYHGRVYVTIDRRGGLAVVNAVPENRLLAGLVPAEIFPSAPDEALRAQAIAARGELLVKIGTRHAGEPFRLCAETHCQVYAGASRETPRTTAAVEATRGEVLFEANGKDLVDTVYSANCGGHTEHSENVWPDLGAHATLRGHRDSAADARDPFAGGVGDALLERFLAAPPPSFCGQARQQGGTDRFRWTVTRKPDELARLLAAFRLGQVKAIEVLERGVSGRARAVRITGDRGAETVRGELRIRQTFGGLRSSMFLVEVTGGAATFTGGGFGHGVGMCQTGSIGMAETGKSYRDILRHYYQGSVLRKLW